MLTVCPEGHIYGANAMNIYSGDAALGTAKSIKIMQGVFYHFAEASQLHLYQYSLYTFLLYTIRTQLQMSISFDYSDTISLMSKLRYMIYELYLSGLAEIFSLLKVPQI